MEATLYDDLVQGLTEAIAFEKGEGTARTKTYTIRPLKKYSSSEIREIRQKAGMTQKVMALYMGVSQKTIEAWECGRTHPTGPASRLLNQLETDNREQIDKIMLK